MQRRVERRLRVRPDIFQQHIDLRELDRPVDGVFRLLRWICETVRASSAANGSASSLALSQSWAR